MGFFSRKVKDINENLEKQMDKLEEQVQETANLRNGNLYLVDYENVHDDGLYGIDTLKDNDMVIIYFGSMVKNISYESHMAMMKSSAKIESVKVERTAKNYLDFQLSTHLGYLIGKGNYNQIFIISKDTGFDSVVDFWLRRGELIERNESIVELPIRGTADTESIKKLNAKKEGAKKDTSKKDGSKKDNSKKDNIKKENIKKENIKKESIKGDSLKRDSTKKATAKKEDSENESVTVDNSKKESASIESPEKESIKTGGEQKDSNQKEKSSSERISNENLQKDVLKVEVPEAVRKKIRGVLKDLQLPGSKYTPIYRALAQTNDKTSYNNALQKTFGAQGAEIFGRTKAIWMDYHQMDGE